LQKFENFEIIEKANSEKNKIIAHCMGEFGEISRILNISRGSFLSYGFINGESAPGQISCEYMKRVIRADKLNKDTKILWPYWRPQSQRAKDSSFTISHSRNGTERSFTLIFWSRILRNFFLDFGDMISGASVTMPYKESV
jgi:hypothetical protein